MTTILEHNSLSHRQCKASLTLMEQTFCRSLEGYQAFNSHQQIPAFVRVWGGIQGLQQQLPSTFQVAGAPGCLSLQVQPVCARQQVAAAGLRIRVPPTVYQRLPDVHRRFRRWQIHLFIAITCGTLLSPGFRASPGKESIAVYEVSSRRGHFMRRMPCVVDSRLGCRLQRSEMVMFLGRSNLVQWATLKVRAAGLLWESILDP